MSVSDAPRSGSEAAPSTGSAGPARLRLGDGSAGFDSALADRVRLYLRVTFAINVCFSLIAFGVFLSGGDDVGGAGNLQMVATIAGVTALNGIVWGVTHVLRLGFVPSIVVSGLTTLSLSAAYTYVTTTDNPSDPAVMALFSVLVVSMVLVLRASLVPSPAFATLIVGTLSMLGPIRVLHAAAEAQGWVFFVWAASMALILVGVTALTSKTIYGVEQRMFAATQLGQYRIGELLGRGGMGEVYLAEHALLRRPTAVKLLRDASSASARDRFRREVQTASSLSHPNTVEIYDYGRTPDGVFYFAMEYVEGATLEDVVRATGPLPAERVLHLLAQVAGSLSEAHRRGLVHRDIKPSNLMLCERGGVPDTLKVMDFGLVRDVTDADDEESLSGTPLYMAPEMILAADGAVPQSDVYSLGATATFLLTGAPPFTSHSLVEILSDHLATEPTSLAIANRPLAELISRCLAKEPAERFDDAGALLEALEACPDARAWRASDARVWWGEQGDIVAAHAAEAMRSASTAGSTRSKRSSAFRY